jgi:hypothetical protein
VCLIVSCRSEKRLRTESLGTEALDGSILPAPNEIMAETIIGRGKLKCSERNLQCYFVQYKFYVKYLEIEPGRPWREAVD